MIHLSRDSNHLGDKRHDHRPPTRHKADEIVNVAKNPTQRIANYD